MTSPDDVAAVAGDAACVIFQQPNVFGCLEPAPDLAAAANEAGALPVAYVDPMSLGLLEAPGAYGCAIAVGEGQSAGNYQAYGGPHYGFLAARMDYVRRMPGRIVGETTDEDGKRAYVLTLQTREQHIRREKATHNMTTNQTLLALAGLMYLSWLGPQGLREVGENCLGARRVREGAARPAARVPRAGDVQGVRGAAAAARRVEVIRDARAAGVHPGLRDRARLRGHGRRAPRLRDREEDEGRHRPARRGACREPVKSSTRARYLGRGVPTHHLSASSLSRKRRTGGARNVPHPVQQVLHRSRPCS